jgi:hypothetical protein
VELIHHTKQLLEGVLRPGAEAAVESVLARHHRTLTDYIDMAARLNPSLFLVLGYDGLEAKLNRIRDVFFRPELVTY